MNDLVAKRELAFEAKDILESKAFEKAKADLQATAWSTPLPPPPPPTNASSTRRPDQGDRRDRRPAQSPDQRIQRRRAGPEPGRRLMAEGAHG